MAEDRNEVIAIIAKKLQTEKMTQAQWKTVLDAVANRFTPTDKVQLVQFLINGDIEEAGRLLHVAIQAEVLAIATAEAEALMADDALTLEDLLRVL